MQRAVGTPCGDWRCPNPGTSRTWRHGGLGRWSVATHITSLTGRLNANQRMAINLAIHNHLFVNYISKFTMRVYHINDLRSLSLGGLYPYSAPDGAELKMNNPAASGRGANLMLISLFTAPISGELNHSRLKHISRKNNEPQLSRRDPIWVEKRGVGPRMPFCLWGYSFVPISHH